MSVRARRALLLIGSACALLLAACGGTPASAAPTSAVPTPAGAASPGCACGPTIPPVSNEACRAAGDPLATLGRVEADLRAGNVGDGYAESVVVGVQQQLVNAAQGAGTSTPLGQSLQGVVSALGELGVSLNQNRPPAQLEPQLGQVDAAVAALVAACAAAG